MVYQIRFTKEAKKDVTQLTQKLKEKLKKIIQEKISISPYDGKKLVGYLTGFYSIRLNYKDRINHYKILNLWSKNVKRYY